MGMCPSRRRMGYKMAKQGGTATTTNREKQGPGEISYPVDDEQKNVVRQCLSEAQEEEKNLVTGITGMNPDSGKKHAESEIIESLPISEWLRVRAIHGKRA